MLPKISSTVHTYTTIKGKKILFSQFTGAHEKILLQAKESEDEEIIINSVLDVLRSIVRSGNVDSLPTYEVEKLLLESRIVSVGNEIEVILKDPETGEKVPVVLDLSKAKLVVQDREDRILLGKNEDSGKEVFLNMKDPLFSDLSKFSTISEEAKIRLCLDSIEEDENITDLSEVSDSDLTDWLSSLERSTLNKISEFVKKIPKLQMTVEYQLKDGTQKSLLLKDFKDFFI